MPSTEAQIMHRLSTLRRVPPASINADNLECPICTNIYSFSPGSIQHAVRVRAQGPNEGCEHTFCRRCIEDLFRSGHVWSTRCPICRQQWFNPSPEDIEDASWEDLRVFMERFGAGGDQNISHQIPPPTVWGDDDAPEPVPMFDAPEVVRGPRVVSSNAPSDHTGESARTFSHRGRLLRSTAFLQYMLSEYDIDAESDERVAYRVQRLERTVERLWLRLEHGRQEYGRNARPRQY